MFQGYTDECFEFFMAIRFNNNREFFHDNYDWYLRGVRTPSIELAAALSETVERIDDALERRPYRVLSHINRDIRFSNDKSPYRDHLWLSFHRADKERSQMPELFFGLSDEGASCGLGVYRESRGRMNALRRKMCVEPEKLLAFQAALQADFLLGTDDSFKRMRVPEAVPEALRGWYCAKGFYLEKPFADFDLIRSPQLADELIRRYEQLAPLYHYLAALVPEADAPDPDVAAKPRGRNKK